MTRSVLNWMRPVIAGAVLLTLDAGATEKGTTFTLTERLDHDWSNELVFFPLSDGATSDLPLVGPGNQSLPYQVVTGGTGRQIAFLADLPAGATQVYRLTPDGPTPLATGLRVEETDQEIQIFNQHIGIKVRKKLTADQGPIAGYRCRSGQWSGDSRLHVTHPLVSYEARVTARGPVFGEVLVAARFEGDRPWTMRIRVIDREPVVVVEETFLLGRDGGQWSLDLTGAFEPTHGIFRTGWHRPQEWPTHALYARPLTGWHAVPFQLLPWINWSDGRQVSSVSLYREDAGVTFAHDKAKRQLQRQGVASAEPDQRDVLFFAAGRAGEWARPGKDRGPDCAVPLTTHEGRLGWQFQLDGPARQWILGTSTFDKILVADADLMESERYAIKHCGTALQEVNEMTLVWGEPNAMSLYPRVAFGREDLERLRRQVGPPPFTNPLTQQLWREFLDDSPAINQQRAALARDLVNTRIFTEYMQVRDLKQGKHIRRHDHKVWTHTICRPQFITALDDTLGRQVLTPEEFTRVRARAAFVAHKFASPDFYSHERGWHANPNMTTMRHAVVGLLGCLLADHPRAKEWYQLGAQEFVRQLNQWVGPNGGWLESPHYQSIIGDGILLLAAAQRNGLSDDIYHPNLLKTVQYLAKISTPPDPRFGGRRTLPPVGNTYRYETTALPGILAKIYRTRNPVAASDLQWMWLQHGKPRWTGIGGGSGIVNVIPFFLEEAEPSGPPAWGSEVFPKSGTVLRSHFPSNRETYLYLLHGDFKEHYDDDRGSFLFWGKGQPLCLDWGYAQPYSSDMHNMLTTRRGDGRVAAFHSATAADYLHVDLGPWQRRVMFIKDSAATGANFAVVFDTSADVGRWHQWFYTKAPLRRDADVIRMRGRGDVDLDVWLAGKRATELPALHLAEAQAALAAAPADTPAEMAAYSSTDAIELDASATYLKSRNEVLQCPEGIENGSNVPRPLLQRGLTLNVGPDQPVWAVYYPRMAAERVPVFTELAGGKGVRVESAHGTDYVFLGHEPFVYEDAQVRFRGSAGAVRVRGKAITLTLSAAGEIGWGPHRIESEQPASRDY